jgi:hypothetical protein
MVGDRRQQAGPPSRRPADEPRAPSAGRRPADTEVRSITAVSHHSNGHAPLKPPVPACVPWSHRVGQRTFGAGRVAVGELHPHRAIEGGGDDQCLALPSGGDALELVAADRAGARGDAIGERRDDLLDVQISRDLARETGLSDADYPVLVVLSEAPGLRMRLLHDTD